MYVYRFLIVLLLVFAACSEGDNPVNVPAAPDVIMPLGIGSQWAYQRSNYDADGTIRVRDTISTYILGDTLIDSERWFVYGVASPAGEFFTNKADGLWYRQKNVSTPGLYAKYPAQDGDIFIERNGDTVHVVSTNQAVEVPDGTFLCYEYMQPPRFYAGQTVRFRYRYDYCPGIGLIRMQQFIIYGINPEYLRYSLELLSYSIAE
jgi:hypothetical protein